MNDFHFSFAPAVLRRLGEELLSHPDQGIMELVRNAYDADATTCTVGLENTSKAGGTLIIEDDGDGMDESSIASGWLILGRSHKASTTPTRLGRIPVGDKGLGRLGALRLGTLATLRTRPRSQPGTEFTVALDWNAFDAADTVESVGLQVREASTTQAPGTTIEITSLKSPIRRQEIERLARALILLSDPFENELGFRASLKAHNFQRLERLVRDGYFDDAEFHLEAAVDSNGIATARVLNWRGEERWRADHGHLTKAKRYAIPPTSFDFWAFLMSSNSFASRTALLPDVRKWIELVGGVHVYERKLRVPPYGDPGHDWLDLNLARARSPEERPSTNNSIGRVVIQSDSKGLLMQKTDRSGYIETAAFLDLRQFCIDSLDWMARERVRAKEALRQQERRRAPVAVSRAQGALEAATASLTQDQRVSIERAVDRLGKAQAEQVKVLKKDVLLYRTLATVGTTAAVFAHESAKPAQEILRMARTVNSRAKALLGKQYAEHLAAPVDLILDSAKALKTFASLPLFLLAREKRHPINVDVAEAIRNLVAAFEPMLKEEGIAIHVLAEAPEALVYGNISSIDSIVANFIINSVNAFKSDSFVGITREIEIRLAQSGNSVIITFLDTGPGIQGISIDDIWLPGETTTATGTGLGLTIVQDTVRDLGGNVTAQACGERDGAEFIVSLPMVKN